MDSTQSHSPPSLASLSRSAGHSSGRRWQTLLTPTVVLTGLAAVLWFAFRDRLQPAVPVNVAQVVLLEQDETPGQGTSAAASELLFQASGWVEPDPWPVRATVLAKGVVREVLVKEGEPVSAGQVVARLDDADARLALDARRLDRDALAAGVAARCAAVEGAQKELQAARAAETSALARLHEAADAWRRIRLLDPIDTTPTETNAVARAKSEAEAGETVAAAAAAAREADLRRMQAELARDETVLASAAKAVEIAELNLARMTVHAPVDGLVLRRLVEPGAKRGLDMDDPDSATILTSYDPRRLQVRADVPLSEAGRLRVGQPARITTALLGGAVLTGAVTRIVGEADMQRNTLQAKVVIHDPDPRLRPETLCRVEFWSASGDTSAVAGAAAAPPDTRRSLWVPEAALRDPAARQSDVWVVKPESHTVELRNVRLADGRRGALRRVEEGLRANEMVVTRGYERLTPGVRAKPQLEKEPTHDDR